MQKFINFQLAMHQQKSFSHFLNLISIPFQVASKKSYNNYKFYNHL